MRQASNPNNSAFNAFDDGIANGATSVDALDLHASTTPADSTTADISTNDPVGHTNQADTAVAGHAPDAAPSWDLALSGNGIDGTPVTATPTIETISSDGSNYSLTDDGGFWFNDESPDNHATPAGGNFNSGPADLTADASTDNLGAVPGSSNLGANADSFHGTNADSFHDGASSTAVSGAPESSSTAVINSESNSSVSGGSTANVTPSVANPEPAHSEAPPSAPSAAPMLAYTGDLGDGVGTINGGSAGTGSGTGSSGGEAQSGGASAGLVIDVDWDSSVANAPSGFVTAVDQVVSYYESVFSNPITITIDVGYGEIDGTSLQSGALGESETYLTSTTYSQLQSALVTNDDAIGETAAAASLPATSPVSGQYWVPLAEAAALGLPAASASVDGYVGFSSTYGFAYNDSNGVPAGKYDFFGTAAHEISEVMGRIMNDGSAGVYYPLDLFHYSAPGVRDFSGTKAGYFSANGGTTNLGSFNTNPGGDFGDWAASVGANSYLAYSNSGVVNPVTANDLTEMNTLGWDPVTSTSAAPTVTIALVHDTGGTNNITSNDALTGSADANATVTLTEGTTVLGATTANASGVWSFTPSGLSQGAQTVTASETNAAGLTGSASLTFTYDTVAPTVAIQLVNDTGGTNNITSNDALTGSADANATVTLTEGTTALGTTTANATGVWSFTPSGLAQGVQTVTASETNAAGLTGSASLTFTYDTVAPIVAIQLVHDTGGTNNITSNDALTGSADANATVTLTEGATVLGSTTANANGVWSFTPSGLSQGAQTVTASETNAAGLTGTASLTFTYDTVAPAAPVIVNDTSGANNTVTLAGTAAANSTVTIYDGQTALGAATTNASGNWTYTTGTLSTGLQSFTATATDAANNTSVASNAVDLFVGQVATPTIVSFSPDSGVVGDGITNATALILTGTATANSSVQVFDGSIELGTATVNASGVWSYATGTLANGSHSFTATDAVAGSVSAASAPFVVTVDTIAPTVTIQLGNGMGASSVDPPLTGTADPNAVVTLTEGSTVLGAATANASGAWSFTPTGLPQGTQTIVASETDAAGNIGTASLIFALSTIAYSNGEAATWAYNVNGTINNVDYYDVTGQAYTSYDVVYGANNKPATETFSNGVTETLTYNSSGTLQEVVTEGITGQKYTSTDIVYGANGVHASEVWANAGTTIQTETWNANGTVNTINYYDITGQAYTSYDVVYGANNKPATETFSNGMTETLTYNSSGTLQEVVTEGITGQKYTSTDIVYGANGVHASEVWANDGTTIQTETWNANGTVNTINYYDITGQAYTSYDVVYGANNKPASETFSNGMTEALTYNSSGTLQEVVTEGITGQKYTSTDIVYGANGVHASEVWANDGTTIQTETWNTDGTVNTINYYDITGQAYTSYEVVYGANNKPATETFSNGMTETLTYNSSGTLQEVVTEGITGQKYTSTDIVYGADNKPATETWSNGTAVIQTEVWNTNGTVVVTNPSETYVTAIQGSTIAGGAGANVLDGSAGNVNITAGSGGPQTLIGGPGDILTGGSSSDTFIFPTNLGNETVNNFNTAHDVIDLPAAEVANFAAILADMHTVGDNTVIAFDAHDLITLSHVAAQNLTAQNFHFMV